MPKSNIKHKNWQLSVKRVIYMHTCLHTYMYICRTTDYLNIVEKRCDEDESVVAVVMMTMMMILISIGDKFLIT